MAKASKLSKLAASRLAVSATVTSSAVVHGPQVVAPLHAVLFPTGPAKPELTEKFLAALGDVLERAAKEVQDADLAHAAELLDDVEPRQLRDDAQVVERMAELARTPLQLSGGQQQRVAVARALANHPSVILADEPTAALDSHRGRQVMELFRNVAREHGAGVIVVTHDQRTLEVFDAIYEMEDGVIHQQKRKVESATVPERG